MLNIDSPYNHIRKESTSNYNPKMVTNRNYPILDDAYFMFWKGKKLGITGKNKPPDK